MNLIFIHGAPAVGKLTVAKELFKITGYKIFHSHLSMDLVNSIFEGDTEMSYGLIRKIRLLILETAAKVRVPNPIEGSVDGLLVFDSYGGPALAERVNKTESWR